MKYKIENKSLDITNYPLLAKHFEDMASKGWLIHKVLLQSIFIYKKIEPEELDFSITPYEIETAFAKKSKKDLKEFRSVCENVGWNYACKSHNLHIYFKKKGFEALDLETDEEDEFNTIERIAKRQILAMYLASFSALVLSYFILFFSFIGVELIRDGNYQTILPILPIILIPPIVRIISLKKFLKVNRENIKIGRKIQYKDSKSYFGKIVILLVYIIVLLNILYKLYAGIILKNNNVLLSLLTLVVVLTIISIFSSFIKPSRIDSGYKVIIYFVVFIIIGIVSSAENSLSLQKVVASYNNLDPTEYRVLSANTFGDKEKLDERLEGKVLEDISFTVPRSYEYSYFIEDNGYIKTEYSDVLTEGLAKTLVNQYIKKAKDQSEWYTKKYQSDPKFSLEEDKENLWKLDELYYLNYDKTEILIREGKEVFYLDGKDFSDPEIIEIVKEKLDL